MNPKIFCHSNAWISQSEQVCCPFGKDWTCKYPYIPTDRSGMASACPYLTTLGIIWQKRHLSQPALLFQNINALDKITAPNVSVIQLPVMSLL